MHQDLRIASICRGDSSIFPTFSFGYEDLRKSCACRRLPWLVGLRPIILALYDLPTLLSKMTIAYQYSGQFFAVQTTIRQALQPTGQIYYKFGLSRDAKFRVSTCKKSHLLANHYAVSLTATFPCPEYCFIYQKKKPVAHCRYRNRVSLVDFRD